MLYFQLAAEQKLVEFTRVQANLYYEVFHGRQSRRHTRKDTQKHMQT